MKVRFILEKENEMIESREQLLNHLCTVISESLENNEDALRESFAEEGMDYDKVVEDGLKFIKTLKEEKEEKGNDC